MTHTVFYDTSDMRAMSIGGVDRLMIKSANGSNLELHMPLTLATAIADVFRAHQAGEAAALRARQMNAELPADQRDVLLTKGMIV